MKGIVNLNWFNGYITVTIQMEGQAPEILYEGTDVKAALEAFRNATSN